MPGSYEVKIQGLLDGTPVENVLHYSTSGETDNQYSTAIAIADAIALGWLSDYMNCMSESYECTGVAVRGIIASGHGTIGTATAVADTTGATGVRTGQILSNQNGPFLTVIPTLTGLGSVRARAGKLFLPGVTETDAGDNVITDPLQALLIALATSLGSTLALGGGITGTWRQLCKVAGTKFLQAIVAVVSNFRIASQRRRRPSRY